MTLVQASIAGEGESVILIADRLLTTRLSRDLPSYEFESPTPKIVRRGNVGVGFAGSSLHADVATSKIRETTDFDEIINIISDYISKEREERIEKHIKRLTGVSSEDFFTKADLPIPKEVRGLIYNQIRKFDIKCHSIIAGFDKKNVGRIVAVDEEGDKLEATNFGVFSVGTGSPFSQVYFDQCGYTTSMPTNEAILFAFEAKKWAQAHTGVGAKTDMLVFRKENKEIKTIEIYEDSELMKKMYEAYQTEIDKRDEMRKKLLKELFGNKGGD